MKQLELEFRKQSIFPCPSCGRTLFDYRKQLKKLELPLHLKFKIVNGPGRCRLCVGSRIKKVTLYKGQLGAGANEKCIGKTSV